MSFVSLGRCLATLCLLTSCGGDSTPKEEPIRPVRALKTVEPESVLKQTFPGLALATQEINLSFRIDGPLVSRPAAVGDQVGKGDLLAQIDPRDFELHVQNLEGQLEQALATLKRAEADLNRLLSIQAEDPGATSEKVVDEARQHYAVSTAQLKSLNAELETTRNQLSDTKLLAPFSGRVVATFVENYQDVRAKQEVIRLLDTSEIEMVINVPESSMRQLSQVKEISVKFDNFPTQKLKATVKELGTEASQVTRTYPIRLIMNQLEGAPILPGMAGKAEISSHIGEDDQNIGIEVPATAVASDRYGRPFVWVVDPQINEVERRYVDLGMITDNGMRIKDGVKAGEWVVTSGVHYLERGQKVRLMVEL